MLANQGRTMVYSQSTSMFFFKKSAPRPGDQSTQFGTKPNELHKLEPDVRVLVHRGMADLYP